MAAKKKVDRAQLAKLTADGWTVNQLAKHFGAHPSSISRLRGSLGISTKPTMTPERKAAIERMLADEWSFAEISRTEGADQATLRKHFPGRAWTEKQRIAHLSTLRRVHDWNGKHHERNAA